jgi:tetratricopeptide (TPR) repeat protein
VVFPLCRHKFTKTLTPARLNGEISTHLQTSSTSSAAMSPIPVVQRDRIFISYRRDDARGASGRVWDWLRLGFGRDRVFRDVASIGAGRWRRKIDQAMAASAACVAVIGRRWADATNLPRLQDPNDLVRHELETALAFGERDQLILIPLLVEEANLVHIPPEQLPESLRPLLGEWNVLSLSESGWDDDTRRLIEAIATATGLPVNPDLEEWLALMAGAQQGLNLARGAGPTPAADPQGEDLALEGLLHRAAGADPDQRPALKAALEALARGDTLLAEQSFEQVMLASRRLRLAAEELQHSERRREAEAAHHIASLALLRGDLGKAVRYFALALEADPEDHEVALDLAHAWISLGDLAKARQGFEALIAKAVALCDRRQQGRAQLGLGDVLLALGDGRAAQAAYQIAQVLAAELAQEDPYNCLWQRDLAICANKRADLLRRQGDSAAALELFRQSLAITEALARRDPANSQWQRDLSVSHERVGGVLLAQGGRDGALAAFRTSLAIRDDLVGRDPTNSTWQRDRAVMLEKIADLLLEQGNDPGSLLAHQESLNIRAELARRDPVNSQWQRDLSVSHDRIGNALLARGDHTAALEAYRASLRIREELVRRDPANNRWQEDLCISRIKIGDGLLAQGDETGALAAYQASLSFATELAERDPANSALQRQRYVSAIHCGDLLLAQSDETKALTAYEASLAIATGLSERDPTHNRWQLDVATACAKLSCLDAVLPVAARMAYLERGRDLLLALKRSNRLSTSQQDWTAWFDQAMAELSGGSSL